MKRFIEYNKSKDMAEGLRGTGNPGMPTPYDQGRADAKKGRPYDNPYNQPGEEQEHRNYRKGYEQGKQQGVAEGFSDIVKGVKRKVAGKADPKEVEKDYAVKARREIGDANRYNNPAAYADSDKAVKRYNKVAKVVNKEGVAEGSEIAVDRKTGKVYMPNKELDKLLNQHKAQFQGMTAIEKAQAKKKTPDNKGVAEAYTPSAGELARDLIKMPDSDFSKKHGMSKQQAKQHYSSNKLK